MRIEIRLNRFVNLLTDKKEEIQDLKDYFGNCTNNGTVGCTIRQFSTAAEAEDAYKKYVEKFGNTLN